MRFVFFVVKWLARLLIVGILAVYLLDKYMALSASEDIYSKVKEVPQKRAALLLGTAKYVAKGKKNYFQNNTKQKVPIVAKTSSSFYFWERLRKRYLKKHNKHECISK